MLSDNFFLESYLSRLAVFTNSCRDMASGKVVADKFVPRPLSKEAIPFMMAEVEIQAQLGEGCLHLISMHEIILTKSHLALVLEYASGAIWVNSSTSSRQSVCLLVYFIAPQHKQHPVYHTTTWKCSTSRQQAVCLTLYSLAPKCTQSLVSLMLAQRANKLRFVLQEVPSPMKSVSSGKVPCSAVACSWKSRRLLTTFVSLYMPPITATNTEWPTGRWKVLALLWRLV